MNEVGLISADDPRWRSTLQVIRSELLRSNRVLSLCRRRRFRRSVMAFTACTFWFLDALARAGKVGEARELFEDLLVKMQSAWPDVRAYRSAQRRTVGKFPTDLFDGRHHQRRDAPVAALGERSLGCHHPSIARADLALVPARQRERATAHTVSANSATPLSVISTSAANSRGMLSWMPASRIW